MRNGEHAFRVEVPKGTLTLVTIPEPLWTRAQVAEWLVFWHEAANDDLFMYELPAADNVDFADALLTLGRDLALPPESVSAIADGLGADVPPDSEIPPATSGWQPATRSAIGEIIGTVADNSINLPDCRTFCVAHAPIEPDPDNAARRRPPFRVDDDIRRPRAYVADIVDRAVLEACVCRDGCDGPMCGRLCCSQGDCGRCCSGRWCHGVKCCGGNGGCCRAGQKCCGSFCCLGECCGNTCCEPGSYCADSGQSRCCLDGVVWCAGANICCNPGSICLAGFAGAELRF